MNMLEEIKPILDKVYPDRYDIVNRKVVIHFPEVTIRNSRRSSRKIYDLFVSFELGINAIQGNLEGMRTTYDYDEAYSGYVHSHLPHRNIIISRQFNTNTLSFDRFCLGTSELGMILSELRSSFSTHKFEMFLYILESYVSWESLEGGPYFRIDNISLNRNNRFYPGSSYISTVVEEIVESCETIPLIVENVNNRRVLKVDNNSKDFYDKVNSITTVKAYTKGDSDQWYLSPSNDGSAFNNSIIDEINEKSESTFTFRGNTIKPKINRLVVDNEKEEEGFEYRLPTQVFIGACKRLDEAFKDYIIDKQYEI